MVTIHNLGFPRIGAKRELKFAVEKYWKGEMSRDELLSFGSELRGKHFNDQSELDLVPVGDFSFYDQMLDMSFTLGNLPERVKGYDDHQLDNFFRVARGRSAKSADQAVGFEGIAAGEMTKWFDTNYHYIVPEFTADTTFNLDPSRYVEQIKEAKEAGVTPKPVIIGPLTYLALGKEKDDSNKLDLLDSLIDVYVELLKALADTGVTWVQIDEPILVTDLEDGFADGFKKAYEKLAGNGVKILLSTYFGELLDNEDLVASLPVDGVHVDTVNGSRNVESLIEKLGDKVISLGVISGRNIWKADLNDILDWVEPLAERLGDRLFIAPSSSLLHVPVDLDSETDFDKEVKEWLAFAKQKLAELIVLKKALNNGRDSVSDELTKNKEAIESRRNSPRVTNPKVQEALKSIDEVDSHRKSPYAERAKIQAEVLGLPLFPTTTIGSFPQTKEIRQARSQYKNKKIDRDTYVDIMQKEIKRSVDEQEALGLDVLVHGEAERNDMVEYFGEQLEGYVFSKFGWVQSYGSRCVKPPILFGDISRPEPMTVEWTTYAQSLTDKPMKGMLTGPVTILNWSFVRDDQPRSVSCKQLALALREEVMDLEKAGVKVIQIDEAALREGLPLRRSQWKEYLDWAVECFRITSTNVADETQIHTHMCYSEFNDIIESIAEMDTDAITIETSRSDMELLDAFDDFKYPNEIGPGVYDIHSPNIPTVEHMVKLMEKAAERIPAERLWVNPDCGLKTRQWEEVIPALTNMVSAAKTLRENYSKN